MQRKMRPTATVEQHPVIVSAFSWNLFSKIIKDVSTAAMFGLVERVIWGVCFGCIIAGDR